MPTSFAARLDEAYAKIAQKEAELGLAIELARDTAPVCQWIGTDPELQEASRCAEEAEACRQVLERRFQQDAPELFQAVRSSYKLTTGITTLLRDCCRSDSKARKHADSVALRHTPGWQTEYEGALSLLREKLEAQARRSGARAATFSSFIEDRLRQYINDTTAQHREALDRARQECAALEEAAYAAYVSSLASDYLRTNAREYAVVGHDEHAGRLDAWRTQYVSERCDDLLELTLDRHQASAVGFTEGHALAVARAGSGKTRTLVARAAFLVRHCRVDASQILLLAFNRDAAKEMLTRLERLRTPCPHVMTFHALGYAIVRPEGGIVCDEPDEEDKQRSALMQRVVNEFLRDSIRESQMREVMSRHFRTDWDKVVGSGMAMSREEGLLLRRSLERESLDGKRVKSFGEKVIANFLFEHGISYGYGRNHWWDARNYRPDFTLSGRKVVIEYFGLTGDPEYDADIDEKRRYWAGRRGWTLLEYLPSQLGDTRGEGLQAALARDLTQLNVPVVPLSEEEIWRRVEARFRTRFAEVITGFIGRCRKALVTPEALDARLREHECLNDIERDVLSIGSEAYRAYLERLKAENQEDFDGLLQRAAQLVQNGETVFERRSGAGDLAQMRFIMVDEYQDFSPLFDRLLSAIRSRNRNVQVLCVGDDWQAINGFAGSDLRLFHEFVEHFQPSTRLAISTNYRSSRAVVETGNRVMVGKGEPAVARGGAPDGEVMVADLAQFRPEPAEAHHWQGDAITPAVRRIMHGPLKAGQSIALLARQRYLPYPVCRPEGGRYPKEDVSRLEVLLREGLTDAEREQVHVGTAHTYKGREADVVILLDVVERRFPKFHPDWVFGRIFGDTPAALIEEERRLFYVACTRAINRLVMVTERGRESPFLKELRGHVTALEWDRYCPFCPDDGDWMILVGSVDGTEGVPTKARAEMLKAKRYVYEGGEWPHWRGRIAREHGLEWIIQNLPRAIWFPGPGGLEVRICRSDGSIVANLVLEEGELHRREC